MDDIYEIHNWNMSHNFRWSWSFFLDINSSVIAFQKEGRTPVRICTKIFVFKNYLTACKHMPWLLFKLKYANQFRCFKISNLLFFCNCTTNIPSNEKQCIASRHNKPKLAPICHYQRMFKLSDCRRKNNGRL